MPTMFRPGWSVSMVITSGYSFGRYDGSVRMSQTIGTVACTSETISSLVNDHLGIGRRSVLRLRNSNGGEHDFGVLDGAYVLCLFRGATSDVRKMDSLSSSVAHDVDYQVGYQA